MVFNLRTFSFTESVEEVPTPPKSFSLKEIRAATHNFSSNNIVGYGWFGKAYRGRLADGSLVAVERVSFVERCFVERSREEFFEAAVQVGSTVSMHPNVLCLRGFCRTKKELLLVYPLMINNSLSYNLRKRPDRFVQPLDWTTRKRIALGAARGLAHLHDQVNFKIMHRSIGTSSILLNEHFEAVIGGFSLAVIMHERNVEEGTIEWPDSFSSPVEENSADSGSNSQTYHRYEDVYVQTAHISGRLGYTALEYFHTGKCTLKNDVFAYGRMLFELISGQPILRPMDKKFDEAFDDVFFRCEDWARKLINEDRLGSVIDPNLWGNYVEEEAELLLRLARLCSHKDPSIRPEMPEVVRMLESQFLQRDPSTMSSWSQSEGDSTAYYSFPPSPSPLGTAP